MKIQVMIFLITLSFFFDSCRKKEPKPNIVVEKSAVVWSNMLSNRDAITTNNFIYKNLLIQGLETEDDKTQVFAFTLDSGKLVWKSDILPMSCPFYANSSDMVYNMMVLSSRSRMACLNLDNGNTIWQNHIPYGNGTISVIDEKIYKCGGFSDLTFFEIDLYTGDIKPIFSFITKDMDNFESSTTPPVKFITNTGDKILVMGNRLYNKVGNPYFHRFDYFAYNLSKDSFLWYKYGEIDTRAASITPISFNNQVYFKTSNNIVCLNPLNGDILWEFNRLPQDNQSSFGFNNIVESNGVIITFSGEDYIYGIDANTGILKWVNKGIISGPYVIRVGQNKVWSNGFGIVCIDAINGKTIFDNWKAKLSHFYNSSMVLDEKTGYLYTVSNGNTVICFDTKLIKQKIE